MYGYVIAGVCRCDTVGEVREKGRARQERAEGGELGTTRESDA